MSIDAGKITVTTTASKVWPSSAAYATKGTIAIKNPAASGQTIWLGRSNVTVSGANVGFPVAPGEGAVISFAQDDELWAVSGASVDVYAFKSTISVSLA